MGYTGVGGIAGMMYNGEIAGSYNLGTVNTTRNAASFGPGRSYYSVNMGGIVGDTTEETNASALLYDVYNKGQIGDETFTYYARHVGGIVGRLSGTVEKPTIRAPSTMATTWSAALSDGCIRAVSPMHSIRGILQLIIRKMVQPVFRLAALPEVRE